MANYQIMYWQDIPSQFKVSDADGELVVPLDPRMMEIIDAKATELDLISSDAYLEAWHWGEQEERAGSAQEVADALKEELEAPYLSA